MAGRVLDVGNCGPDHAAITRMMKTSFGAEVVQTDHIEDTLSALRTKSFDLVLINRKLDCDYSDGIEVLKRIKSDPSLAAVPVMLVTNYAEYQAEAIAHGALMGFGKLELQTQATRDKLAAVLSPDQTKS